MLIKWGKRDNKKKNEDLLIIQPKKEFLTAGAASSAPSADEKVTCFSPFSFINLGPSCAEEEIKTKINKEPSA